MLVYHKTTGKVTKEKVRVPSDDEVVWIRLLAPKPEEVHYVLGQLFRCHPLLVEDCVKLNQRPKLDRYANHVFITFFAVNQNLSSREMGIVIGRNFVITIYRQEIPFLETLYDQFLKVEERMQHAGDILYHILDRCVDEYVENMNLLDDKIDKLERAVMKNPAIKIAGDIYHYKRAIHRLRRIFAEERNTLSTVSHPNFPYTRQEADVYFIDIYDHLSRVADSVDIFRESLTGLLELQMNMKSDRMNEIMKTLTIVSSFFLPLTFIVGLYGMNFHNIPELNWKFGYLYVWIVMGSAILGMFLYYRSKKWF